HCVSVWRSARVHQAVEEEREDFHFQRHAAEWLNGEENTPTQPPTTPSTMRSLQREQHKPTPTIPHNPAGATRTAHGKEVVRPCDGRATQTARPRPRAHVRLLPQGTRRVCSLSAEP